MKHHTKKVKAILERRGYKFVKFSKDGTYVYYITPKDQLARFEECDLILFYLFG